MTAVHSDLVRIEMVQESTFAADPGTGYADFLAFDVSTDLTQKMLEHAYQKDHLYHVPKIPGSKACQIGFKVYAHGHKATAPTGDPTAHPLAQLVEACTGIKTTGKKVAVLTGSSATSIKVTEGTYSFGIGDAMAITIAADGLTRITFVTARGTTGTVSTYTVYPGLDTAPANLDIIYGSLNYAPNKNFGTNKSVTLWIYLDSLKGLFKLTGCRGDFNLTMNADELPVFEFTFQVASWTQTTHAGIANPTITAPDPQTVLGTKFLYVAQSAAVWTDDSIDTAQINFKLGQKVERRAGVKAAQGVTEWWPSDRKSTLSFVPDFDDAYMTAFQAQTAKFVMHVLGSGPGKYIVVAIPSALQDNAPKTTKTAGRLTNAVDLMEGKFITDGTRDGTMMDTEVRICFL